MISDEPGSLIAERIRAEREQRGWSLGDLAGRSGVSKAMISKIERRETSPTAVLLGRLSSAFGLTLSTLLARAEGQAGRLLREAEQPVWQDPATGYRRRQISPPVSDPPIELTRIELPPGAEVAYPAGSYSFIRQMIWVLSGRLTFVEGGTVHDLGPGDCLALGPPQDCVFRNKAVDPCSYLVVVLKT